MSNWEPFVCEDPERDWIADLERIDRAQRLTRRAQIGLLFIIVCCGTAGLLILMYQGF